MTSHYTQHRVTINLHNSGDDPLTKAIIISHEIDCAYSAGSFYEPFSFLPKSLEQKKILIDMLDEYGFEIGVGR